MMKSCLCLFLLVFLSLHGSLSANQELVEGGGIKASTACAEVVMTQASILTLLEEIRQTNYGMKEELKHSDDHVRTSVREEVKRSFEEQEGTESMLNRTEAALEASQTMFSQSQVRLRDSRDLLHKTGNKLNDTQAELQQCQDDLASTQKILDRCRNNLQQKTNELEHELSEKPQCPERFFQLGWECFLVETQQKMTWKDARRFCQGHQGDLAQPRNVTALQTYVWQHYGKNNYFLGASEVFPDQWLWLSGKSVDKKLWGPGEPNWDPTSNRCVHYWFRSSEPVLSDYGCDVQMKFICEFDP